MGLLRSLAGLLFKKTGELLDRAGSSLLGEPDDDAEDENEYRVVSVAPSEETRKLLADAAVVPPVKAPPVTPPPLRGSLRDRIMRRRG